MRPARNSRWLAGFATFSLALLATSFSACKDGELAGNPDDHPQIVSVRIIDDDDERDTSAAGEQVMVIDSVSGPEGACENNSPAVLVKSFALAIYMQVPNTQEELDIDAFLTLVSQNGQANIDPAEIVTVSNPTVVYNQPGSAKGLIKAIARIQFSTVGNFSGLPGANLCSGSGPAFYNYSAQAVVLDREFRGDAVTFPIQLVDNTADFCKASSVLCPD